MSLAGVGYQVTGPGGPSGLLVPCRAVLGIRVNDWSSGNKGQGDPGPDWLVLPEEARPRVRTGTPDPSPPNPSLKMPRDGLQGHQQWPSP